MTNGTTTDVTKEPPDTPWTPYALPTAWRSPVSPGTGPSGGAVGSFRGAAGFFGGAAAASVGSAAALSPPGGAPGARTAVGAGTPGDRGMSAGARDAATRRAGRAATANPLITRLPGGLPPAGPPAPGRAPAGRTATADPPVGRAPTGGASADPAGADGAAPRRTAPDGAVTHPVAAGGAGVEDEAVGPGWGRSGRGRHRKPRPRRVMFAVGGLALAAGALSLARMAAPESVVGGGAGNTEAEPRPGVATGEALDAAPTVWATPSTRPASQGATPAQVAVSATPASGVSPAPTAPSTAAPSSAAAIPSARASVPVGSVPDTTGIPTAPVAVPSQPRTQQPSAPSPTTRAPAPSPSQSAPGLCVPIIGICVNDLAGPAGGH